MFSEDSQRVMIKSKKPATSICYDLAIRALLSAEIQIERIWSIEIYKVTAEKHNVLPQQLVLMDLHFYFISLRNIYRYLAKIVEDQAFENLKSDLAVLNDRWFKHYSSAREAFEHIDQRLPKEIHENRIVEVTENEASRKIHYGLYITRAVFAHSDKEWDISEDTYLQIKNDVQAFLDKLVV